MHACINTSIPTYLTYLPYLPYPTYPNLPYPNLPLPAYLLHACNRLTRLSVLLAFCPLTNYIFSCGTTHSDIRPGSGGGAIRLASASGATAFFDPLEVSLKIGTSIDINAPKRN